MDGSGDDSRLSGDGDGGVGTDSSVSNVCILASQENGYQQGPPPDQSRNCNPGCRAVGEASSGSGCASIGLARSLEMVVPVHGDVVAGIRLPLSLVRNLVESPWLEISIDRCETDIQEQDKKKAKNKQSRARNGKDKVKPKPKSVKVKSQPIEENTT
ncbi:hypothetical protein Tco_0726151 [Tanacetum coccineum]|uniref:Uncharacterized protein n=1 Tax=Tanacetum coccineum TaxID=301880 RepID=A0ABQ4YH33_9ASTR